ncbi:MAG TPA: alpha/beta hydrolase [Allosphingosinicella sp.]|jgi:pimeloyl-ACP methyl ester carboxylesterase
MRRRRFLAGLGAAVLLGCAPAAVFADTPFAPTRFSVEVRGSGPDVILIPGLTAGPEVFAGTVAAVPGYRYHLVHVAGMAGAPAGANARGAIMGPLADELVRYIASRGLRPALIGHSMGGTLAMMVAARRPDLARRVMVIDMYPQPAGLLGGSAQALGGLAERLGDITATPSGRRLFADLVGSLGTNGPRGRSDPDVVARAMRELAAIDLTPDLPRIAAPLTVVYANADAGSAARTDAGFRTAYARATGAELVRIDGSGHMIMFDQPARLHEVVRSFLDR